MQLYTPQTIRPYTEELMVWDEAKQRNSFAAQWKLDQARIIAVDGTDVGWLQVEENPTEIRLLQFFITPERQRTGIGTEVLRDLLATWRAASRPIALSVLKNNPARRLYERAGFVSGR